MKFGNENNLRTESLYIYHHSMKRLAKEVGHQDLKPPQLTRLWLHVTMKCLFSPTWLMLLESLQTRMTTNTKQSKTKQKAAEFLAELCNNDTMHCCVLVIYFPMVLKTCTLMFFVVICCVLFAMVIVIQLPGIFVIVGSLPSLIIKSPAY